MKPRLALAAAALLLALSLFTFLVKRRMEHTVRVQAGNVLRATLDGAAEGVRLWADSARIAVEAAASDTRLQRALTGCLEEQSCSELDVALDPFVQAGGLARARVVSLQGVALAQSPRDSLEEEEQLTASAQHRLEQLAAGKAAALHSVIRAGGNALLLAAPLHAADGRRVATLIAHRPFAPLSAQLAKTRVGKTGESYVFDAQGRMLSESRFWLAQQGAGKVLRVREPPPSSQLTRAAAAAIEGRAGADVLGYPDYRGVRVIGAWAFLPELQLGVVSEVDAADAYRTLDALAALTTALVLGLIFMLALSAGFLVSAQRLRRAAAKRAERFGQYNVERKLGEGGMGAVYLASHALMRRKAAIKLLREGRGSPEALAAFEREVQITSTLTHPNTVSIYDYGRTEEGTFYYVMEYLEGLDLQRLVEVFGPLPQARVLAFVRQLCGSLAEAHAAGVVHRDVKPANLIACTRGGVADALKVLDFGIAHVQLGAVDDALSRGTPEYMAPELFESPGNASPQSDLYSVGLVAYYLLTGAPPFSGGATTEICHAHLTAAPEALTTVLGEPCDPVLDAAVAACLKKQPSARPSSAGALAALLERSAIAHAWTAADAEAWWQAHRDALDAHRASAVPEPAQQSGRRSVIVGNPRTTG